MYMYVCTEIDFNREAVVAYIYLFAAVLFEIAGTSFLKTTEGFTRLWPTVACLAAYGAAFLLLAQSLEKGMQVGIAYAIWAGLGISIIAAIGILFLGEPISTTKLLGISLIIGGVVTLNLSGAKV